MKLYYSVNSPYARIVRAALIETGLQREVEPVLLTRERLYSPQSDVQAINPTGKVPTLLLPSGVVIAECREILDFVDIRSGGTLIQRDGRDGWTGLARLGQAFGLLESVVTWLRAAAKDPGSDAIAREQVRTQRILAGFERETPPDMGRLTAGEIVLATALGVEARLPGWRWRADHPRLTAWFDAASERPSLKTTAPDPL